MENQQYFSMDGFEHVYLEDSFVLDIQPDGNCIVFTMEFVLTEDHPLYVSPLPDEQYCYRKGTICFNDVASQEWKNKNLTPTTDSTGDTDYGGIDHFYQSDNVFHVAGDWGQMEVVASSVAVPPENSIREDRQDNGCPDEPV